MEIWDISVVNKPYNPHSTEVTEVSRTVTVCL
jgi:hypothetical protein